MMILPSRGSWGRVRTLVRRWSIINMRITEQHVTEERENLQKGGRCDWTETVWFPSLAPFPTTVVGEVSESTCWDLQWVVLCLHLYYTDTLPRLICRSRYYNPGLSPTYDIKPVRWLDNFILGLSVYYWECNMSKNYFIIITLKNVIYGQL